MTAIKKFNSKNILIGAPLQYNVASQLRYDHALTRASQKMAWEVQNELLNLFQSKAAKNYFAMDESIASQARIIMNAMRDKFFSFFDKFSKIAAKTMVEDQDKSSSRALKSSLKTISEELTIDASTLGGSVKDILKASVAENVALIKSIPDYYLTQVEGSVMRSITTKKGLDYLIPQLRKYEGITERKAKNIALDQTRKVYNNLNTERMKVIGIEEFKWLHSGGGQHPREEHIMLDGTIHRIDDPPVINSKTGTRGFPAEEINCGCTQAPVIRLV